MMKALNESAEEDALEALSHMDEALAALDRAGFAAEIGAQLDLVINRLRELLISPLQLHFRDQEVQAPEPRVAGTPEQ
jgi:hypothetical protein